MQKGRRMSLIPSKAKDSCIRENPTGQYQGNENRFQSDPTGHYQSNENEFQSENFWCKNIVIVCDLFWRTMEIEYLVKEYCSIMSHFTVCSFMNLILV